MPYLTAILLVFAGALSGLALPPVGLWWVPGLSFAILLWSLETASQWRACLGRGLAFGLGYFVAGFHWIGFAFLVDAAAYLWMMPFAVGGLALMMACYWAVAIAVAGQLRTYVPTFLGVPASLATVEWLRGHLFTGFPWSAPGQVVDGMGGVLQLASLVGMPGLTLMVLLWAFAPYALLRGRGPERWVAACILVLLPAVFVWGEWRLQSLPTQLRADVVVRLVQPNIGQSDKWRSDNAAQILDTLIRLSRLEDDDRTQTRVVVWPEAAVPFLLDEEPEVMAGLGASLPAGGTLLAGSIRRRDAGGGADAYFTSVLQIDGGGAVRGIYDKWRLVPGGEFLPLEWLLSPLGFRKIVSLPESLTPGPGPRSLDLPGVGLTGVLICYEAIFPHRLVAATRPSWIVNVTNDGWFGVSAGPHQHFAQVRMRAVEQGLPIARSANTGISAMIDPLGRVVAQTRLAEETVLMAPLPAALPPTVYSQMGDFALATLLIVLALLAALVRAKGPSLQRVTI